MRDKLFPSIEPYHTGNLKVSEIHTVYYEEVGNPEGVPILFLHGGPGGGTNPRQRRYFDPKFYRIILFDQRGCGKSTPYAELKENTTWDLVCDIEKIREELNIDTWFVFGGSWGSTLALAYATEHKDRVKGLILRGIFLCRKKEIQWFYQDGASNIFPESFERYKAVIPEDERGDYVSAYYKRLTSEDEEEKTKAAIAWSTWEAACSHIAEDSGAVNAFSNPKMAIPFARIECHYFINNVFVESDDFLLNRSKSLSGMPVRIVQGRYDIVCPPISAYELHQKIQGSELIIVPDAGHAASEPGIEKELVKSTELFKKL